MMHQMHEHQRNRLPSVFCWTRFGTEAGEPIEGILGRKELERQANDGVFLWGIGNSVAPGIAELVRRCEPPEALFSPIKSRPRPVDVRPPAVVAWTAGETLSGRRIVLPPTVRVTSRGDSSAQSPHYALVCSSEQPLTVANLGRLEFAALRNLLSGNRVGASQVTAVVRYLDDRAAGGLEYPVALRARLVAPYFIRLRQPVPVHPHDIAA
jgi:hypothetical protein